MPRRTRRMCRGPPRRGRAHRARTACARHPSHALAWSTLAARTLHRRTLPATPPTPHGALLRSMRNARRPRPRRRHARSAHRRRLGETRVHHRLGDIMTTTVTCRHEPHRAVVELHGPITWPGAMELVTTVDALIERYSYRHVELVVTSPGGLIAALEHLLRALERWRARDVDIDTRVVAEAASAAAVLVALGDTRIAEPGARMLFHLSRVLHTPEVTANLSSRLHSELTTRGPDARRPTRRAGVAHGRCAAARRRARRPPGARAPRERGAETAALALRARPRARRRAGRRRRRRAPRRTRAQRASTAPLPPPSTPSPRPSPARCASSTMSATPQHASSRPRERPDSPSRSGPPSTPPTARCPARCLPATPWCSARRGAGKTASAVLPLVAAMARAPRERLACALVIDPKREIAPVLERIAPNRVQRLDADTVRLDLMAGPRWSLDADLAAGRWTSAARKGVACASPRSSPRHLFAHSPDRCPPTPATRSSSARALSSPLDVVAFVLMLTPARRPRPRRLAPRRRRGP